jgi:septal ring factor EnvC (AmiA/AmiB activator)
MDAVAPRLLPCCHLLSKISVFHLLQAKAALTAAQTENEQLNAQLRDVSNGQEVVTAQLQELNRQVQAAEVRRRQLHPVHGMTWCHCRQAGRQVQGCSRCLNMNKLQQQHHHNSLQLHHHPTVPECTPSSAV